MKRCFAGKAHQMLTKTLLSFCWALILTQTVATAASFEDKRIGFTVPAAPWTLTLPADNFMVAQRQIKPGGEYGYFFITDETRNLNVSMYIEPVVNCKDSKSCRDMVWKMGNPAWGKPQNVIQSEIGDVSVIELMVPTFEGQPVRQQNMYAEFVVDGFWVDLHISKVLYKPEEHELFERIVKSIKFEPKNTKST